MPASLAARCIRVFLITARLASTSRRLRRSSVISSTVRPRYSVSSSAFAPSICSLSSTTRSILVALGIAPPRNEKRASADSGDAQGDAVPLELPRQVPAGRDYALVGAPLLSVATRGGYQSGDQQPPEERPVLLERRAEVLGRGLLPALPLRLEAASFLGERVGQPLHQLGHECVGRADRCLRLVDEPDLDLLPALLEPLAVIGREQGLVHRRAVVLSVRPGRGGLGRCLLVFDGWIHLLALLLRVHRLTCRSLSMSASAPTMSSKSDR